MKIRDMIAADLPSLQRIYLECRKKTFHWISGESFHISDFEQDTKGEWILVAEEDSKAVGFSAVWTQENFLHHLFVDPSYQGLGIGKSLLLACLDQRLRKPARLKCVIRNRGACRFYESQGWRIGATTQDGPMGPYNTYVLDE